MRALLDTNIIVDLLTARPPEGEDAMRLLTMWEFGDIELWVSAKSYTDVFYVMNKENESEDVQRAFLKSFDVLNVCALECEDLRKAAERSWKDFEDCLIDVCAEKVKADYLLTRDKMGFKRSKIRTLSPKEFFEHLETDLGLHYEVVDF